MSQLMHMRQRIKTIETIQKITHAMQLISMSTHLRLRDKKTNIEEYERIVGAVFAQAASQHSSWKNDLLIPSAQMRAFPLIVLIGSQKGLCGTFNTNLFYLFEKDVDDGRFERGHIVSVGKKTTEYLQNFLKDKQTPFTLIGSYDELSYHTAPTIAWNILDGIKDGRHRYSSVSVYSNYPASFFTQRQKVSTLIPLVVPKKMETELQEEYLWYDDSTVVLDTIAYEYLRSMIHSLLIQSFFCEQSARFLSMDGATRNAERLREAMLLQYNKIRQAKITRELTELSGSYQGDFGS